MTVITRAYKFRVNPTPNQETAMWRVIGCCRFVYNMIQRLARDLHATGAVVTKKALREFRDRIPDWKAEHPFLKEVPSHCLQEASTDLGRGWDSFYGGRGGLPKFRKKFGRANAFRFPDPNQFEIGTWKGKSWLVAPKFGRKPGDAGAIEIVLHQKIKGKIKTCTISREGGYWVASFITEIAVKDRHRCGNAVMAALPSQAQVLAIETDRRRAAQGKKTARPSKTSPPPYLPKPLSDPQIAALSKLRVTAADRNTIHPVVTDEGLFFGEDIMGPKEVKKLSRLQRKISEKEEALRARHGIEPGGKLTGIRRGTRLQRLLRRQRAFWAKIARKREHMLHQIANALLAGADVIVLEDLDLKKMTASAVGTLDTPGTDVARRSDRTRRLLDKAHGRLREILTYKAAWDGRKLVIRVNPAYTSQRCHSCKSILSQNRDGASFFCLNCLHEDHADVNAAKNIRELGIEVIRELLQLPEFVSIGRGSMGRWDAGPLNAPGSPDVCPA